MQRRNLMTGLMKSHAATWAAMVTSLMVCSLGYGQQGNGFLQTQDDQELKLTGYFQLEQNTRKGYLVLTAKIPEGHHIYSLTQKDNPPPSKIEIATASTFRVEGKFQPEFKPTVVENDPVFGGRVEKHKKSLRFFIPLELADTTDAKQLTIRLRFNGQVCSDQGTCMPVRNKIVEAAFDGYFQRVAERKGGNDNVR